MNTAPPLSENNMMSAALPSDSVKAELTSSPRPAKKNAKTASRTPKPLIDSGIICTARLIGTMTEAARKGNWTARLCAAQT